MIIGSPLLELEMVWLVAGVGAMQLDGIVMCGVLRVGSELIVDNVHLDRAIIRFDQFGIE